MTENSEILKNLKQALLYICLFILFRTMFILLIPFYMHVSPEMNGPIDARVFDLKFFDEAYVRLAKNGGYIPAQYYNLYFPLDLAFPVIYTSMFLTALHLYKNRKFYKQLRYIVFAGMIFDYLENISFALYLRSSGLELSLLVAFFTTIKSILFVVNFIGFLICIFWGIILLVKTTRKEVESNGT